MTTVPPANSALVASETRHADLLVKLGFRVESPATYPNASTVKRPRSGANLQSSYYQDLHEGNDAYQENNWLTSELNEILLISGKGTVVEIGCGNGQFTRIVAPRVASVHAFDWAKSKYMESPPSKVSFHHGDVRNQVIPQADVVCSADVLEHFAPKDLAPLVAKFCSAASGQHHVIACYDDGHSHLTVMPPSAWLALFKRFCPTAYIQRIECRRNKADELVCVISTKARKLARASEANSSQGVSHLDILKELIP